MKIEIYGDHPNNMLTPIKMKAQEHTHSHKKFSSKLKAMSFSLLI